MSDDAARGKAVLFLVLLALAGIGGVLFSTKWGAGLSPDSIYYIGAARNLSAGLGYTAHSGNASEPEPVMHFPPLFSVSLSAIGKWGVDPAVSARWFNAVLFGINIFLAGFIVLKYVRGALWPPLACSFLVLASEDMLYDHAVALSEPLFFFLSLLGLLLLIRYLERRHFAYLFFASLAVGLAFLTRYTAAVWVCTGVFGLFFLSKRTLKRKVFDCLIFILISSLPLLLWSLSHKADSGRLIGREAIFHLITLGHLRSGLSSAAAWVFSSKAPRTFREVAFLVLLAGLSLWILLRLRRGGKSQIKEYLRILSGQVPCLLIVFILGYAAFLFVTITFFDDSLYPNPRIVSPFYLALVMLIPCVARDLCRLWGCGRSVTSPCMLLCLILLASFLLRGTWWVADNHRTGLGYAGKAWKESDTLKNLSQLPAGVPIYSNGHDAIYVLTGRPARTLPVKLDPRRRVEDGDYRATLKRLEEEMRYEGALLVWFDRIDWRNYLPSEDELEEALPLTLITDASDGAIYGIQ